MEAGRDDTEGAGGTGSLGLAEAPSGPAEEGDADEHLIGLVAEGDPVAFEELFARHRGAVLSVCRRLLGPAEAEDAMQQTFLAAYLAVARRGERPRHLRAWLRSIARNECISELRRRRASASMPHEVEDPASATDDVAMQKADVRGIVDDVRRLPSDQRAALLLSGIDERPHDEIAEHLECRTGKVKALVFQARATLSGLRAAREVPCHRVREQVSRARVGRPPARITRHLQTCPSCAEFASEFRQERRGALLLIPFGAALEWVRSLLGASGATAQSAVATAGGVAAGGGGAGAALGSGLAKLGILAIAGGAAAGAGAGAIGHGGEAATTELPSASSPESDPVEAALSGGGTSHARNGGVPWRFDPAHGGERSLAQAGELRRGDEEPTLGAGGEEGGSVKPSPLAGAPPGVAGASADAPAASESRPSASRPAKSRPTGGPGQRPSPVGPDGAGPPANAADTPSSAGSALPEIGHSPSVGHPPEGTNGCPVPVPANTPVC